MGSGSVDCELANNSRSVKTTSSAFARYVTKRCARGKVRQQRRERVNKIPECLRDDGRLLMGLPSDALPSRQRCFQLVLVDSHSRGWKPLPLSEPPPIARPLAVTSVHSTLPPGESEVRGAPLSFSLSAGRLQLSRFLSRALKGIGPGIHLKESRKKGVGRWMPALDEWTRRRAGWCAPCGLLGEDCHFPEG